MLVVRRERGMSLIVVNNVLLGDEWHVLLIHPLTADYLFSTPLSQTLHCPRTPRLVDRTRSTLSHTLRQMVSMVSSRWTAYLAQRLETSLTCPPAMAQLGGRSILVRCTTYLASCCSTGSH